jgi:hypothetical protein
MNHEINCSYRSIDEIKKEIEEMERSPKKSKTDDTEFVKDGLTTQDIRSMIKNIRDFIENNKRTMNHDDIVKKLETDHAFFAKRYPMLFSMATDNQRKFDYKSLEYFLNMRDKIISNEMTSEQASIKVGKDWFDKYVDVSKLQKKK